MAYTDLTTEFDYKDLLTWQNMDTLAENDALFQKRFTGDAGADGLIPGPLRVANNIFVKWRNVAGDADIDGIKLNASDQLELGATLKTPVLSADPVAALEAATKQYVDGAAMAIGLVPRVQLTTSQTGIGDSGLVDVINFSGVGRLNSVHISYASLADQIEWLITVDGVVLYDTGIIVVSGGDEDLLKNITNNTATLQLVSQTANPSGDNPKGVDLFYFKNSLRIQQRVINSSGGTVSITTTVDWEHQ